MLLYLKKMRVPTIWIFSPFLFIGLMLTSTSIFSAEKKKWGSRASPVVISQAVQQFLAPTIQVPGTVVSRQQAEIPAEVTGKLLWVADVGSLVKWGDDVARLDDTLANLKASENRAALQRAKTRLKYLNKELARQEELIKSNFASKGALDKLLLDRDIARADLVLEKAKVKLDEETLTRYLVRAPFNGVILNRVKREGEWIASGDSVVILANPKKLEIIARVSIKSIQNIKKGRKIRVINNNKSSMGTVRAIVGVGDTQSHLFDIRIDISAKNWLAGQTVRVDVPVGVAREVLAVPRDALVLRRNGVSLFRVGAENKAEKISVETGITGGLYIEVIGDLEAGDKIITRGNERLRSGQTVKIQNLKGETVKQPSDNSGNWPKGEKNAQNTQKLDKYKNTVEQQEGHKAS